MRVREEINIKNSVLDYIRYKQLNWYGHVQKMDEEMLPLKNFGTMSNWKRKKRKTMKFVDEESYSRNEREGN